MAKFLMVMMRLRMGLLQEHLADIFKVSTSTVSRTLIMWTNFLYDHIKGSTAWPNQQQLLWNLFKISQTHRLLLIEQSFFMQKPSSLLAQNLTWSEYKRNKTVEVLIGVTPSGMVNFVSHVYGGHISDRCITDKSRSLPRIDPGMTVMAHKSFTIQDMLLPEDVDLNIPPRILSQRQISSAEFFQTSHIAQARIVVGMKLEQIKNYEILNRIIPISEMPLVDSTFDLCCTNKFTSCVVKIV